MRLVFGLSALVAAAIVGSWWWLGRPIPMPPSPFDPGEKLYCVSYTPFRGAQTPLDLSTRIDAGQIEDDLARLAPLTDCVRTYSTDLGLDRVAEIAERHGLKVIQGLWLGREAQRNRREIETVVGLAKRYPAVIRSIVVGNEVLLRGELSSTDLAGIIRDVKAQVTVPVTYAEVWEFWLRFREVYEAVDFVTIHILPYWEDFPVAASEAAAHVDGIRRRMAAAFPGKEIFLGEVGWPSAGRMRDAALPSPADQARVLHEVLALAKRNGVHVNLIEAFDQPWKRELEGTVGGYWGLLDADAREPKFAWGAALSNHPHWPVQAVAGLALAAAVLATAAGRRSFPTAHWLSAAIMALVPGILIGWAIANVAIESLGPGGWLRSLAMVAIALAAPIAGAAALVREVAVPGFSRVLARRDERPRDRLAWALGLLWVALCVVAMQAALGLVFDPRYRDFPFAPLGAAAAPFVVLALNRPAPAEGQRGVAESVTAAVLGLGAVYIALNEGFANWQSLGFCAVLASLTVALLRSRDARSSG